MVCVFQSKGVYFMSILLKSSIENRIDLSKNTELLKLISGGSCGCKGKKVTKTTNGDTTSYSVDAA